MLLTQCRLIAHVWTFFFLIYQIELFGGYIQSNYIDRLCVYVCVYTHVYICVVYVYIIYIDKYVYIYKNMCIHTHIYVCIFIWLDKMFIPVFRKMLQKNPNGLFGHPNLYMYYHTSIYSF